MLRQNHVVHVVILISKSSCLAFGIVGKSLGWKLASFVRWIFHNIRTVQIKPMCFFLFLWYERYGHYLDFSKSKDLFSKKIKKCFDRTSFCNCAGNDGFTMATRFLECDQQEILLLYPVSTEAWFEGNFRAFNPSFGWGRALTTLKADSDNRFFATEFPRFYERFLTFPCENTTSKKPEFSNPGTRPKSSFRRRSLENLPGAGGSCGLLGGGWRWFESSPNMFPDSVAKKESGWWFGNAWNINF